MNQIAGRSRSSITTGYLYVASMTIAFTTRYGDILLSYYHQIIIGAFWIAFGLMQMAVNGFKYRNKKELTLLFKLYLVPHIVIHLYTMCLMILGKVSWSYFTTNLTVYIPTAVAVMSIYLFKQKAILYNIYAIVFSWILSVTVSLMAKGPAIFPHAVLQAYVDHYDSFGGLITNYLELHDLVLAAGYIIVFYFFSKSKLTTKNIFVLAMTVFIMTLGMKRGSILGLFAVIIINVLIKRAREDRQYKICRIGGIIGIIFCYMWVYIFSHSEIYQLLSSFGINTAGRNFYYTAVLNYAEFSPSFLGIGRNVVTQLLNNELAYLRVGGVHSDIIKMYVENGFIMFGFWLWYYLVYVTRAYRKHFGFMPAVLYFDLLIYTFTLYLTDNIEIYFICQIFSIVFPATYALYGKTTWIGGIRHGNQIHLKEVDLRQIQ